MLKFSSTGRAGKWCSQEALFSGNVLVESVDGLKPLSQAHIVDSQGIHKCGFFITRGCSLHACPQHASLQ